MDNRRIWIDGRENGMKKRKAGGRYRGVKEDKREEGEWAKSIRDEGQERLRMG